MRKAVGALSVTQQRQDRRWAGILTTVMKRRQWGLRKSAAFFVITAIHLSGRRKKILTGYELLQSISREINDNNRVHSAPDLRCFHAQ